LAKCEPTIRLRFIHRYRLSNWCRYPEVDAQVTIVPPLRVTGGDLPAYRGHDGDMRPAGHPGGER